MELYDDINFLTVGYHKGEMDFGVNGSIRDLSYEEMKSFREMIVVAIGTAEDMWRREQENKSENKARSI